MNPRTPDAMQPVCESSYQSIKKVCSLFCVRPWLQYSRPMEYSIQHFLSLNFSFPSKYCSKRYTRPSCFFSKRYIIYLYLSSVEFQVVAWYEHKGNKEKICYL
jgi:hypothetical protein